LDNIPTLIEQCTEYRLQSGFLFAEKEPN
jgi:hypothetical protein